MYTIKQRDYYRVHQKNNREKWRAYNRKSYLKHKEKRDKKIKDNHKKVKNDVIGYYSDGTFCCKCCGVTGNIFLTIDHIKGDGALLRKRGIHKTGSMFYIWLRKNNYPSGFQVLCHNCNQAKRQLSICPHNELTK